MRRFFDSADASLRMTDLRLVRFFDLPSEADKYFSIYHNKYALRKGNKKGGANIPFPLDKCVLTVYTVHIQ